LAKGGLSLIGILWNQESPQAVINDQSVKVGDQIGPNKVVAIMPDKVVLNDGTSDFELDLQ
jgi:Tfp pilus assembly protein PilP